MRKLRISTLWLRRIHKWVGLTLGLQFILWTFSGAMMALIDTNKSRLSTQVAQPALSAAMGGNSYQDMAALDIGEWIKSAVLLQYEGRIYYEVEDESGVALFDAINGKRMVIDADFAQSQAQSLFSKPVRDVIFMDAANLDARKHDGPMWRVNFADGENHSAYISAETGRILELRNDHFRRWDFLFMLHNMDYLNRASFNHPLIIFVAFGTLWLSLSGFLLLFKSFRHSEFQWRRYRIRKSDWA